jgi:hypothetical protein
MRTNDHLRALSIYGSKAKYKFLQNHMFRPHALQEERGFGNHIQSRTLSLCNQCCYSLEFINWLIDSITDI